MSAFTKVCACVATAASLLVSGTASAEAPAWTATSAFSAPDGAAPGATFAARLDLTTTQMTVEATPADKFVQFPWAWWGVFDFLAAKDPAGAAPLLQLDTTLFPGLPMDIVITASGDVIPAERGLIRNPAATRTASFWEMIPGPGRAWAIEDGWSRASFPISLAQSYEGEAWLGLASFDYKGSEVTPLRVQFSSVSAGGFLFWDPDFDVTAWAEVPATVAPTSADVAALDASLARERAALPKTAPLADLGEGFQTARALLDPKGTLALAVLMDGTLYMDPVDTPFGPHPYPRDMRVGVWSTTKSLIPGLAAMRLAQKFGPEFLDTTLVSYFVEGAEFAYVDDAARARWQGVTIRHALNMMTGMGAVGYDPNWAAENLNTYQWSYSYDLADQIRFYFNVGPNPEVAGPGEKMAYIDQDMWIATLAMERFLKSKEGDGATILGMLTTEVYDPIGASHFATGTGYTETGAPGVPLSAWGALPTIDILAKAGALVANGGKGPDGSQILHPDLVASLFASPDYGLAFWRHTGAAPIVPYMGGAGGNDVLALPNGMAIVVLGRDSFNVDVSDEAHEALIAAARALKPF
jgi:hypothetical protein